METESRFADWRDEELSSDLNVFADADSPQSLKEWSARDFSNIYVRFRPHLERHAMKFLKDPGQADEVVQEAFLYLMTSLPEIDSEIGVLKFLKWKTKMLALDVIRATSRTPGLVELESVELRAKLPSPDSRLEQADDAAIVSLALSKLSLRQREAIIASVYEEKSTLEAAEQLGLSENAFRQLLFRSRAAFKKALVGEAETANKSVAEILSIAARKAARESGRIISAAGVLLLVLAVAINLPGQSITEVSQVASEQPATQTEPSSAPIEEGVASLPEEPSAEEPAQAQTIEIVETAEEPSEAVSLTQLEVSTPTPVDSGSSSQPPVENQPSIELAFASAVATSADQAGFYLGENRSSSFDFYSEQNLEIFGGQGLSVFARYVNGRADRFVVELVSADLRAFAVPTSAHETTQLSANGQVSRYLLSDFYLVGESNQVLESDLFLGKTVELVINSNSTNGLISASLFVISIN